MLFGIILMLFALSPVYTLSLAPVFALGLTSQFYMTSVNPTLQLNLPEQLRGRVMGISGWLGKSRPIGGTFAGTIAEFAGAPVAVLIGGAMVAGSALRIVLSKAKIRRLEPQCSMSSAEAGARYKKWLRRKLRRKPAARASGASSPASRRASARKK